MQNVFQGNVDNGRAGPAGPIERRRQDPIGIAGIGFHDLHETPLNIGNDGFRLLVQHFFQEFTPFRPGFFVILSGSHTADCGQDRSHMDLRRTLQFGRGRDAGLLAPFPGAVHHATHHFVGQGEYPTIVIGDRFPILLVIFLVIVVFLVVRKNLLVREFAGDIVAVHELVERDALKAFDQIAFASDVIQAAVFIAEVADVRHRDVPRAVDDLEAAFRIPRQAERMGARPADGPGDEPANFREFRPNDARPVFAAVLAQRFAH